MDVGVAITLLFQEIDDSVVAPQGPMVAGKVDFRVGEKVNGLVDIATPFECVTHLSPSQRINVVHIARHDLCAAEGFELREVKGEFCGSLGARCVLENELDAVDGQRLARGIDDLCGLDDARAAKSRTFAQT